MLRKVLVTATAVASLTSSLSYSLGLGEVTLTSSINEPLAAEIRLIDASSFDAESLVVRLADQRAFEFSQLERVPFLSRLNFRLDVDRGVVLVSSADPVREPYLSFLVEAKWASGKVLREYTLLLDLPTLAGPAVTAPVQRPAVVEQPVEAQQPVTTPVAVPAATVAVRENPATDRANNNGSYLVRDGDTLWSIAKSLKPAVDISVQQMIVALQQTNPDAFVGGDINRLMRGATLAVPTEAAVRAIYQDDAVSQVRSQTGAQASGRLNSPQAGGAAGTLSVTAGDDLDSQVGEELDGLRNENEQLRQQVDTLEEQNEVMSELVELRSAELARIQTATKQAETNATPAEEVVEAEESANELASAVEEAVVEPVPVETARPVSPPLVQAQTNSTPAWYSQPLYQGIGLGGLVLLLGGLLWRRRQHNAEGNADEPLINGEDTAKGGAVQELLAEARREGFNDGEVSLDIDDDKLESTLVDYLESVDSTYDEELNAESPIAAAEGYLAFDQFDQARELLENALERGASDTTARLKLLEVLVLLNDQDAFDEHADVLNVEGDEAVQTQIDGLRASFEIQESSSADELAADSRETAEDAGSAQSQSDDQLDEADFETDDLDSLYVGMEASPTPAAESTPETANEVNADFELDLGDLDYRSEDIATDTSSNLTPEDSDNGSSSDDEIVLDTFDLSEEEAEEADLDLEVEADSEVQDNTDIEIELATDDDSLVTNEELNVADTDVLESISLAEAGEEEEAISLTENDAELGSESEAPQISRAEDEDEFPAAELVTESVAVTGLASADQLTTADDSEVEEVEEIELTEDDLRLDLPAIFASVESDDQEAASYDDEVIEDETLANADLEYLGDERAFGTVDDEPFEPSFGSLDDLEASDTLTGSPNLDDSVEVETSSSEESSEADLLASSEALLDLDLDTANTVEGEDKATSEEIDWTTDDAYLTGLDDDNSEAELASLVVEDLKADFEGDIEFTSESVEIVAGSDDLGDESVLELSEDGDLVVLDDNVAISPSVAETEIDTELAAETIDDDEASSTDEFESLPEGDVNSDLVIDLDSIAELDESELEAVAGFDFDSSLSELDDLLAPSDDDTVSDNDAEASTVEISVETEDTIEPALGDTVLDNLVTSEPEADESTKEAASADEMSFEDGEDADANEGMADLEAELNALDSSLGEAELADEAFEFVDPAAEQESAQPSEDENADYALLGGADEAATKLDLARAYINMEDIEGAMDLLDEVIEEATDEALVAEARAMRDEL